MNTGTCQNESPYPTHPFSILCLAQLLTRPGIVGGGVNEIGLTPLGEPMPKFFIGVDLVFSWVASMGGGGVEVFLW